MAILNAQTLLYGLAIVIFAGLTYPIVYYIRDPKGLRKYPSPNFIAASTPLWQMYHNWKGQKYVAVHKVHHDLGPVVRLGPNHVSFDDPQAYKDIYGHGTGILKDLFYKTQGGDNPNMAEAIDRSVHRQKRRNLAHVFAAKQITAMEPRVMEVVKKLVHDLDIKSKGGKIADTDRFPVKDGVFDLRPWLNMFSYDAITNVFWSQTYGFLDRGDDDCWAECIDGSLERVHAMETFHTNVGFSVLMGHLSPFWFDVVKNNLLHWTFGGVCGRRWAGMARHLATERMRNPPSEPDLFSNLPTKATDKHPDPMTPDEILAESGVMLNAGNDTTQSTLTNAMYELARNPEKQVKLRKALHAQLKPEEIPIASYESLQHNTYLRAVIDEVFRLRPPLGTGLPRRTEKPAVIAGESIPSGVTVSSQIWSLHRRDDLFKDASTWKPERWLSDEDGGDASDEERVNLKEFVVPFSMGPRACIGRNLAYMELSICIASLVMSFEWELPERSDEIKYHERFNCNPIALPVRARKIV